MVDTLAPSAFDTIGSYSSTEVEAPYKWIDGKTIYRKTISIGALPNNGLKQVAHGISGMTYCISLTGTAMSDTTVLPLPYSSPTLAYNIQLNLANTKLEVTSAVDRSGFIGYATALYVK